MQTRSAVVGLRLGHKTAVAAPSKALSSQYVALRARSCSFCAKRFGRGTPSDLAISIAAERAGISWCRPSERKDAVVAWLRLESHEAGRNSTSPGRRASKGTIRVAPVRVECTYRAS